MIVPPGFRPPTEEERAEDVEKRRAALEQAERHGTMSKPRLEEEWVKLADFQGYPRRILKRRPVFSEDPMSDLFQSRLKEQLDAITRRFAEGLDEAAERQVIAHLRARGYLIARPADQLTDPQRRIAEQSRLIDILRATIATLRKGKSVAPSSAEEG